MSFRRRTYVLLVLAVIVASIATHAFRPGGEARTPCGIRDVTLAVEVCPPRDVDTILGEGGKKVSGGEKQRLSIARALLRKPRLLIFDEATSALDYLTEDQITRTIRKISELKQQITILIAHRLSTIMHADRIYVLEKGKITEQGTHEQLVELKGLYYAMWRQQLGARN